jgi:hypothetical protein
LAVAKLLHTAKAEAMDFITSKVKTVVALKMQISGIRVTNADERGMKETLIYSKAF